MSKEATVYVIAKITEMKKQKRKDCVPAIWQPEKFEDFHFETIDFGSLVCIHSGFFVHFH